MFHDQIQWEIFRWGFMGFVGIVLLVLVMVISRKIFFGAGRQNELNDMSFMSLEKMRETGLMTDEEYARANKKMAQRFVEQSMAKPADGEKAEDILKQTLMRMQTMPGADDTVPGVIQPEAEEFVVPRIHRSPTPVPPPPAPPQAEAPQAAPLPTAAAPSAEEKENLIQEKLAAVFPHAAQPTPAVKKSKELFDLEKLYQSGAIDEPEYKRLHEYFSKKLK